MLVADALAHLSTASLPSSEGPGGREAAQQAARAYAHGHLRADALPSLGIPAGHPVVRSFLGVPLLDRAGEVRGGLLLEHGEPDQFTGEDRLIVVSLAGQAAVALENARLYHLSQRQAAELQAMFDSIADGVTLVDRQGAIRRENAAARQVRQTLLERPEAEQILEDWLHEPAHHLLEGKEVPEQIMQVMGADGERRDYMVRAQPLRPVMPPSRPLSQGGSPGAKQPLAGALVIRHDVTERRLRESERVAWAHAEQLEAIFEALMDGLYVFDDQGRIVQMNTAAKELLVRTGTLGLMALPIEDRLARVATILPAEQLPISRILRGERFPAEQAVALRVPTHDGEELAITVTEEQRAQRQREEQALALRIFPENRWGWCQSSCRS